MRWFFLSDKQEQIPTTEEQLRGLAANGILRPQTLVWREGMSDWTSAGEIKPELFSGISANSAPVGPVSDRPIENPSSVGPRQISGPPPIPTVRTASGVRGMMESLALRTGWMQTTAVLWMLISLALFIGGIVSLVGLMLAENVASSGVNGATNDRAAAIVAQLAASKSLKYKLIGSSVFGLILHALLFWMGILLFRASAALKSGHARGDSVEIETGANFLARWFVLLAALTLIFLGFLLFRLIVGFGAF